MELHSCQQWRYVVECPKLYASFARGTIIFLANIRQVPILVHLFQVIEECSRLKIIMKKCTIIVSNWTHDHATKYLWW